MAHEADWIFLQTAMPELRDYILSNDIYRILRPPVRAPRGVQLPQLTIGNMLLSQARLLALELPTDQQQALAGLTHQFDQVRAEWRANWGRKAEREFESRLNLWQQYLRELRGDARQQAAFYANEVRNRTVLQLLQTELTGDLPAREAEQLTMLDSILRGNVHDSDFVWEPELANGFPKGQFWFLYVKPGK